MPSVATAVGFAASSEPIALGEMKIGAVVVIGHVGAALAALLPARREHEVLHQQLASAFEQVGQLARPFQSIEDGVLVDMHPWKGGSLAGDLVA